MKRRLTPKFITGCAVWVVGSGVTAMAYNKISKGLGSGLWVDAFIILAWAVIAYCIIWGEVFECDCECHNSESGQDSAEEESVRTGKRSRSGSTEDSNLQRGLGSSQDETEVGGGPRKPGHRLTPG